jgi:hypothetical protein
MIGFNFLLEYTGLNPATVKLVRHQDSRYSDRPTPYQLWCANDGRFDIYQRIQSRERFKSATHIAAFVGTPLNETLFVGLYSVRGWSTPPQNLHDPISDEDVSKFHLYDLTLTEILSDYRGRLIIDWGSGYRSWVQRAKHKNKPVLEIRRQAGEPPFPGFMEFRERLHNLATVPFSWRTALGAVGGVYLLACVKTGKLYVGSAYGEGGFWRRWEDYLVTGHGGNVLMKDLAHAEYQVSILEVASSSTSPADVVAMESRWKAKMLTKEFGLNGN